MKDVITRPWDSEYTVERAEVLAQTADVRVLHITLPRAEADKPKKISVKAG